MKRKNDLGNIHEEDTMPVGMRDVIEQDTYFGRMNAPSGSACIKGLCGEEMEFYLVIEDGMIREVTYYTEGCVYTRACAIMAAHYVSGTPIEDALRISPQQIIEAVPFLPHSHMHCAILAVNTLHKALADYLLKP